MIPAWPDSGLIMRQGPSGHGPRSDHGEKEGDANKENQRNDDPMEGKGDKMSEFDLGALERDLLEYDFNEAEGGGANDMLVLMTPSSFMSPTKEPPPSLSPVESMSLAEAHQRRGESKLLSESPLRRIIVESMRVAFLGTFPEEEWKQYPSELERKTGEAWTRVAFMESTLSIIRRYGTQPVMRVGLNQHIMREVVEKMRESTESDGLTQSVTEESVEEVRIMRDQPIRRTKKGLRNYKSMVRKLKERVNDKVTKPKVVKSKAATVVMSLAKVSRPSEVGQGDGAKHGGREKENQVPPMLLAGLVSTASKAKKSERTLADTKLEMGVISQCGSGGMEDYKPSRTNMAKMKLEGQLDVVDYSRINVPESVHMLVATWKW